MQQSCSKAGTGASKAGRDMFKGAAAVSALQVCTSYGHKMSLPQQGHSIAALTVPVGLPCGSRPLKRPQRDSTAVRQCHACGPAIGRRQQAEQSYAADRRGLSSPVLQSSAAAQQLQQAGLQPRGRLQEVQAQLPRP